MMRLPSLIFVVIILLVSIFINAFAWDSSSAYNTIAMSYTANTTITQTINLSSAQQAESTINFIVDVKNGGGRPTHDLNGNPLAYSTQTDTASITIYRYNSAGQLLGQTTSQNYILYNYGTSSNPGWSVAPGDNQHPFTQASVTYTGDLSQVAYIRIEMKGTDGAWWAGNYGPQWRTPTVTVGSSTTNIVYNSEFGLAPNGVQAQGWTPSYGTWAACGVTSGNSTCVTQQSGVTANMWGGGYDANGGTTSGAIGGYSGTLTSNNATQAASGSITPSSGGTAPPTVTGTSVTYTTRTVVNGNTTTVYRTPVTTTTYSDGTSTSSNGAESLYQTRVSSTVTTNTISGNTLTTINTPIDTVTTNGVSGSTVEANGSPTTTSQTIQRGLNFEVFRYDSKTYNCGWLGCVWDFGRRIPDTNRSSYGNPVNSGITTSGMYLQTNARLPNNDSSWFDYNDNTVIRYFGTITAPTTQNYPAGTVYRLYFYNNTDDGFRMFINGQQIIFQNSTNTWQSIGGYTGNGWMDVVAGQTYNIEAWYWNVLGGVGHQLYWDFGAGIMSIPNAAFTTGNISTYSVDTSGVSYSNSSVVNITGSTVSLLPQYVTNLGGSLLTVGEGVGSSVMTSDQQTKITNWANTTVTNQGVWIDQIGDNNTITIDQAGKSAIKGIGQTRALIQGNSNSITINQGVTGIGQNVIEMSVVGDSNTLTINQARTTLGADSGTNGHYQLIDISGYTNTVTTRQSNALGVGGHHMETTIVGNNNNIVAKQEDNGNKVMFTNISGNSNVADITQKGTGQHYLDLRMGGLANNAVILQEGTAGHKATIELNRAAGGANNLDLSQSGNNPLNINLLQTCNIANCGTVTVRQTQ